MVWIADCSGATVRHISGADVWFPTAWPWQLLGLYWVVLGWAGSRLCVTFGAHPMQLWPQKWPNTHPVSNYTHSSALSWDCTVDVTRAALAEIKEHWCVCIWKDLSHWAEGEFQIQTWPIRCLTVKQPPLPKHIHTPFPFPLTPTLCPALLIWWPF